MATTQEEPAPLLADDHIDEQSTPPAITPPGQQIPHLGLWRGELSDFAQDRGYRLIISGRGHPADQPISLLADTLPAGWRIDDQASWTYAPGRTVISAAIHCPQPLGQSRIDLRIGERQQQLRLAPQKVLTMPSVQVQVDGQLDEWPCLPHAIMHPRQILFTAAAWAGPTDGSAVFGVAADAEHLYIGVLVRDDRLVTDHEVWAWEQDAIEIRINAQPDPARSNCQGKREQTDFTYFGIVPAAAAEQRMVHDEERLPQGSRVAAKIVPGGYAVEVSLPHRFLDTKQQQRWQHVRINMAINDFDGTVKEIPRASQMWWWPDWRSAQRIDSSGTFVRPQGPMALR